MSTVKCPECGLVNFASATECKRCHFGFNQKPSPQVSKLKCPECGLVNFASATECKRCHSKFDVPPPQPDVPSAPAATASPEQLAPERITEGLPLQERGAANAPAATLTPLPEYFNPEPAPYTVGMILFAVTVALSILGLAYHLKEYSNFYGGEEWKSMVNPTHRHYLPSLEFLFFSQWLLKLLAILVSLLVIVLFLRKSHLFLRWLPWYLIGSFIFILVDGVAGRQLATALRERELGRAFEPFIEQIYWSLYLYGIALLLTIVWYGYFAKSKQVEKTFIT